MSDAVHSRPADYRSIAYFSMEIGIEDGMPTYSGGLGVLAGDTIRAAADLKVPMVGMTLLHRKGYFYQRLDSIGRQTEEPVDWVVEDFLTEMAQRTAVAIEGRTVQLRSWKYEVSGNGDFKVPVYFLDTDLPENSDMGPNFDPLSLRGRSALPALPRDDSRYRRGEDAPCVGLRPNPAVPYERRALQSPCDRVVG